jgi:hypothetical protein
MTTGKRIRLFGETVYESIKDFALDLNMAPSNLQKYMNSEREPGMGILGRMLEMGCNLNWLLSGRGKMFADNEAGRSLEKEIHGVVSEPANSYKQGKGGAKGKAEAQEFTLKVRVQGNKIKVTEVK